VKKIIAVNGSPRRNGNTAEQSSIFNEPEKAAYRKEVFPKQCEEAYNIGKALV